MTDFCLICGRVKDQYIKYCSQECREKDMNNNQDTFKSLLDEVLAIHNSKKEDYSETSDRFSNFTYSDFLSRPFPDNHKSFSVLVGTKLARLAVLLTKELVGGKPNNESIDDSFKDLTTYCAIWWCYYRTGKK